jgi:Leucine-rich repeat (LRR) protein
MGSSLGKEISTKVRLASKTKVLSIADSSLRSEIVRESKSQGGNTILIAGPYWDEIALCDPSLKNLDISGNDLRAGVPSCVLKFTNLKSLQISRCQLRMAPDFSAMVNLAALKLDHNQLTETSFPVLPTSLTSLDISFNNLSAISSSILFLIHLKVLNVANNQLVTLEGMENLLALEELNCDRNSIFELPEGLACSRSLRSVSVRFNQLASPEPLGKQCIPQAILEGTALQSLQLEGNSLLSNNIVMNFKGMDAFIARRQKIKDKSFSGGALTNMSLFGLD